MTTETIDHATFTQLVAAGAVRSARVVGRPGGWGILLKLGTSERALAAQRSQQIRIFRKFETLVRYLKVVGITRFDVDAMNWAVESTRSPTRPDASAAMKRAHEAAAYDKWLMAEVQEAIDDESPSIPHDEVVRNVRAAISRLRTKRAPA